MKERHPRLPGKNAIDRHIGAGVGLTVVFHFGIALYVHFYLTDGWEIPRVIEQPPRWATAVLAGAGLGLAVTCSRIAEAADARLPLAEPRFRDGVRAAARGMRATAAVFAVSVLWIAGTADADLFEAVKLPLSVAFAVAVAVAAVVTLPWFRRLKRDPAFKAEWQRLVDHPG